MRLKYSMSLKERRSAVIGHADPALPRAPSTPLDDFGCCIVNGLGVRGDFKVADGVMVAALVVHRDEVDEPRLPVVVWLPLQNSALQCRSWGREFAHHEPCWRGDLSQLVQVVPVNDDEGQDDPYIRHLAVVRPNRSQVRPRERSTRIWMHNAKSIEIDEGVWQVRLSQSLGNGTSDRGLSGPRCAVKDKNFRPAHTDIRVGARSAVERIAPRRDSRAPSGSRPSDTCCVLKGSLEHLAGHQTVMPVRRWFEWGFGSLRPRRLRFGMRSSGVKRCVRSVGGWSGRTGRFAST